MHERVDQILRFWFADATSSASALERRIEVWFGTAASLDRAIEREFGADVSRASRGELSAWAEDSRGRLALILLLDQFPRNIFRGTAAAFATDSMALELTLAGKRARVDNSLHPVERIFLYMPMQHAEDRAVQEQAVDAFAELATTCPHEMQPIFAACTQYAEIHRDIIRRFGRFPHRNAILGRQSTPQEFAFLADQSNDFGQR